MSSESAAPSGPAQTARIAAPSPMRHARILGLGGYRPERVVTNEEICERIDSSDEWIRQRSGIARRRMAAPDETVVDMSESAAKDAMAMAGVGPDQIGAVLMATVTHPYQTPAAAPLLALRLGISDPGAVDLSAACAGYCYGISMANDMIRAGTVDYVLVVGVEKLSDFTDFTDRSTAFIFGDGAGAAVVGPSETPGVGPTLWGSDGSNWDKIVQRESWVDVRKSLDTGSGEPGRWPAFAMQGQAVFRWAVYSMAPVARRAIEAAGIEPGDLTAFIPHQANMRITDAMVKELRLPEHVSVARDIVETGNTSAASIPLAAARMIEDGEVERGGLALQIGFGAGLVYAAQVVQLP